MKKLIILLTIAALVCVTFSAMAAGATVRSALRNISHIKHFAVGTAGTEFKSPPVVFCGKVINVLFLKT